MRSHFVFHSAGADFHSFLRKAGAPEPRRSRLFPHLPRLSPRTTGRRDALGGFGS
jgi:hypothetical protein